MRPSLHRLIEMLGDLGVFANRKVTIEVVNGFDVSVSYDPPLGVCGPEVLKHEQEILHREQGVTSGATTIGA